MNANMMNFDLYALAQPKNMQDIIALAAEAKEEMARINGYIDRMFEEYECLSDA